MTHFGLSADDLKALFDIDNIWRGESIEMLDKWGRIEQLQKLFHTDFKKGLCQGSNDRKARIEAYGDNRPVIKPPKTIFQQMCDNMQDYLLRALICTAIFSIIFGLFRKDGWIEGVSVLVGLAILIVSFSVGNHLKNKEFSKTSELFAPDRDVQVIREGKLTIIPSKQVLVGDIMHIQSGDVLTIDGILIEGKDITTDESCLTGQTEEIKKKVPITYQKSEKANPSSSKVYQGQGLVIVAAVGSNSFYGQLKLKIQCQENETPLQRELGDLADRIVRVSKFPTVFCLIILLFHYLYECYSQDSFIDSFFSINTIHQMLKYVTITLCLLMISVPEGLPCCIFLTHCLHLNKMLDEKILVRYINAIEAMASVDNICTDVTDTLIEDSLSVTRIFIQERDHYTVDWKAMLEKTCMLFSLCISCNTTANPIFGQQEKQKVRDQAENKSQRALLEAVHKLGYDYQMLRSKDRIKQAFSFDSGRKKMAVLYEDEKGRLLIFVRGSEDMKMQYYSHFINKDGDITEINHQYFARLNEAKSSYIAGGMRIVMFAYKEVGSIPEDWSQIQKDLIVLALVGIKNPLKKGVAQAVSLLQQANITVRIIAKYEKIAAINAAKQIGILSPDWQLSQGDLTVMQGKNCKQFIGGIVVDKQDYYQRHERVGNLQNFKLVDDKLRVLVRQYPDGKYCMIVGLLGQISPQHQSYLKSTGYGYESISGVKEHFMAGLDRSIAFLLSDYYLIICVHEKKEMQFNLQQKMWIIFLQIMWLFVNFC